MDRSNNDARHAAAVDAWLARATDHASQVEIVERFGAGFAAVWSPALTALGEVTLRAIAERVLATACARHAFLSAIPLHPNGDARWRAVLVARLAAVRRAELIAGLRFGLVELITVLGRLTAEVLSDELHAALRDAGFAPRGEGGDGRATPREGSPTLVLEIPDEVGH